MSKREKSMVAAAGAIVVALVTYMAINKVFLEPAANAQRQALDLEERIARAMAEKGKESVHREHLKALAGRTFGTDEMRVSEQVRAVITEVLTLSGVGTQSLSLKPLVGARVPGVYKEIGWSVRVRGKLPQVINFLYLMSREPHLHRVENVVVTPVPNSPQDVELQAKYATLLLELPPGEKLATDLVGDMPADPALLESPERRQYDVIAMRDVFRPYIPARPQPREEPREEPRPRSEPPPPSRGGDSRFRIVGLPTWGGRTDVLVRDAGNNRVAALKPGDELGGGKIVMVDYRLLPLPKNPQLLSGSRVVLQIGNEYYAVELGQTLADKRVLRESELPPGLPRLNSPGSSGQASGAASAKQ